MIQVKIDKQTHELLHFIDGEQVLSREDILFHYPKIQPQRLQRWLTAAQPTCFKVLNKDYFLKADLDALLN